MRYASDRRHVGPVASGGGFWVWYGSILSLLVLLLVAVVALTALAGKDEATAAMQGGYRTVQIRGHSMHPAIPHNSHVVCRAVPFDALAVGDVILFTRPGAQLPLCHRITYIEGRAARTRGDNNRWPDSGWVSADRVLGVVVEVNGKRIGRWQIETLTHDRPHP